MQIERQSLLLSIIICPLYIFLEFVLENEKKRFILRIHFNLFFVVLTQYLIKIYVLILFHKKKSFKNLSKSIKKKS